MPNRGSFGLVLALHVLSAVVVVGPLAAVSFAAPWLLRWRGITDEASQRVVVAGLRGTTWVMRVLSAAAIGVGALGFVLVHQGSFGSVRSVSDAWIRYSIVLWIVAVAINLLPIDRLLSRARLTVAAGRDARGFAFPLAAAGTASAACWAIIVVLMVMKPS